MHDGLVKRKCITLSHRAVLFVILGGTMLGSVGSTKLCEDKDNGNPFPDDFVTDPGLQAFITNSGCAEFVPEYLERVEHSSCSAQMSDAIDLAQKYADANLTLCDFCEASCQGARGWDECGCALSSVAAPPVAQPTTESKFSPPTTSPSTIAPTSEPTPFSIKCNNNSNEEALNVCKVWSGGWFGCLRGICLGRNHSDDGLPWLSGIEHVEGPLVFSMYAEPVLPANLHVREARALAVWGCDNILNLDGLESLEHLGSGHETVEGFGLRIIYNKLLTSIAALASLRGSIGPVEIASNPRLTSLVGLEGLTQIESIASTPAYTSLSIVGNDVLRSIAALGNIRGSLEGALSLHNNNGLDHIQGILGLGSVATRFRNLSDVSFPYTAKTCVTPEEQDKLGMLLGKKFKKNESLYLWNDDTCTRCVGNYSGLFDCGKTKTGAFVACEYKQRSGGDFAACRCPKPFTEYVGPGCSEPAPRLRFESPEHSETRRVFNEGGKVETISVRLRSEYSSQLLEGPVYGLEVYVLGVSTASGKQPDERVETYLDPVDEAECGRISPDYALHETDIVWHSRTEGNLTVRLEVFYDELYEGNETIIFGLRFPNDVVAGAVIERENTTLAVSIRDAPQGVVVFDTDAAIAKEDDGKAFVLLQRRGGKNGILHANVDISTTSSDNELVLAHDHCGPKVDMLVPTNASVTWKHNDDLPKAIVLEVCNDAVYESPDETVLLAITDGKGEHRLTIEDDGDAGSLGFKDCDSVLTITADGTREYDGPSVERTGGNSSDASVTVTVVDESGTVALQTKVLRWEDGHGGTNVVRLVLEKANIPRSSVGVGLLLTNATDGAQLSATSECSITIRKDFAGASVWPALFGSLITCLLVIPLGYCLLRTQSRLALKVLHSMAAELIFVVFSISLDVADIATDILTCRDILQVECRQNWHGTYLTVTSICSAVGILALLYKLMLLCKTVKYVKRSADRRSLRVYAGSLRVFAGLKRAKTEQEMSINDAAFKDKLRCEQIIRERRMAMVTFAVYLLEDLPPVDCVLMNKTMQKCGLWVVGFSRLKS